MRLPGTEKWDSANVVSQIAFEQNFAATAPKLMREVGYSDALPFKAKPSDANISEAIFALGRAAELAFATEQISLGLQICEEIALKYLRPTTLMQIAFGATVTAATGFVRVELDNKGITLRSYTEESINIPWPRDNSAAAADLLRWFLPSAVASVPRSTLDSQLQNPVEYGISYQEFTQLKLDSEFRALADNGEFNLTRLGVILSLEDGFKARLLNLQNDVHHWEMFEPKGSLIDWRLLCLWVGIYRFDPDMAKLASGIKQQRNDAGEFIRSLAANLSKKPFGPLKP